MIIKEYVALQKEQMKKAFEDFKNVNKRFVIVQMNEDPASNAYIKGKLKDGAELGVNVELVKLPIDATQPQLLDLINKLNNDTSVAGFIVQMPLPKQIDEETIKLAISPEKDVDGFHPLSKLNPCTPQGIMNYLDSEKVELLGKNALVIGRSNIVGKPMARMLLARSANVTVVHSKTNKDDMANYIKNADIIVVAVGKKFLLNSGYVFKSSAIIVDVGINRDEDGLHGDAEPNLPVFLQTPVPGGVGLLTRLALYDNLLKILRGNE